jgi:hypothetical protein
MDDRYDYIAIGPYGVYALCEDLPGDPGWAAANFVARAHNLGHRVERVPVAEACERHLAYLRQDPRMAAIIDAKRP